jgi:hypothetical protein
VDDYHAAFGSVSASVPIRRLLQLPHYDRNGTARLVNRLDSMEWFKLNWFVPLYFYRAFWLVGGTKAFIRRSELHV